MSDLKARLIRLGKTKPELRPHLKPVIASLASTRTAAAASYAAKIVRQALRKERASGKKYLHEAIVYKDWDSWKRNMSSMNGITDIEPLDEALTSASPGTVVDVFVYFSEYDEDEDEMVRGDLKQNITVEIPMTSKGKIEKTRDGWREASVRMAGASHAAKFVYYVLQKEKLRGADYTHAAEAFRGWDALKGAPSVRRGGLEEVLRRVEAGDVVRVDVYKEARSSFDDDYYYDDEYNRSNYVRSILVEIPQTSRDVIRNMGNGRYEAESV
jgi:hypothetical protein